MSKATPQPPTLQIDVNRRKTFVNGQLVKLAPGEFNILAAMATAKGRVLSRQDLLESYHASEGARDIDSRAVDQHISRVRKALGPAGSKIVTVTNFGYQAEGVELVSDREVLARVAKITRRFGQRVGARVIVEVEGSVLQSLREGQKFPLPA